ncbi:hypothetical protein [Deinococcus sp. KNUC1210]|nr:hypothetical protein [Deinococcus sp. KNUC1210]
MRNPLREFLIDLWRVTKLVAAVVAIPLALYLLLLWAGVFH